MSRFTKQPYEQLPLAIEWAGKLPTGVTISTLTVTALDLATQAAATADVLGATSIIGTQTRFVVKGGTAGTQYKITHRIVGSDAVTKLEEDLTMSVVER
jgi:hypothetical protein